MSEAVRIVIATTEGPAGVERLSEEESAVGSVVCLQCKAVPLPVGPAYDAFVRRPTGVIEAAYGHSAYRLDVSAPISGGLSWQLGALAAHGLHDAGRLAGRDDPCDRVIWVTGEVEQTLQVLPVRHLAEKLQASAGLIADLAAKGARVTICVPRTNLCELDPDWRHMIGDRVELLPVDFVAELFGPLGLKTPVIGRLPQRAGRPPRRRVKGLVFASVAGAVVLTLQFGPGGGDGEQRSVISSAASRETGQIELTVLELRAPPGESCAAVRFGSVAPEVRELPLVIDGPPALSSASALCTLRFRLTNRGAPKEIALEAARAGEGAARLHGKTLLASQVLPSGARRDFEVALPRRLPAELTHSFAVVVGPAPTREADEFTTPESWLAWTERLKASGHKVITAEHVLSPD